MKIEFEGMNIDVADDFAATMHVAGSQFADVYTRVNNNQGTIATGTYKDRKFRIGQNRYGAPVAYVQLNAKEWRKAIDLRNQRIFLDIYDIVDKYVNVHGGLTYSEDAYWTKDEPGVYYVGWDYAHAWDYVPFNERFTYETRQQFSDCQKHWSFEEILTEVRRCIDDLNAVDGNYEYGEC